MLDPATEDKTDAARTRFLGTNIQLQVRRMRNAEAVKFYDRFRITNDPGSLKTFTTLVQPFLLQNCATAGCHSAAGDAHNYPIYGVAPNRATAAETVYQLLHYERVQAKRGAMIDRQNPIQSLFIQYALPKDNAGLSAPRRCGSQSPHRGGKSGGEGNDLLGKDAGFSEAVVWD